MTTTTYRWTVGDCLHQARRMARMSAVDLADRLDLSRGTITNYEDGNTRPKPILVREWAVATDAPAELIPRDLDEIREWLDSPRYLAMQAA